jgi:hypothetical protein
MRLLLISLLSLLTISAATAEDIITLPTRDNVTQS